MNTCLRMGVCFMALALGAAIASRAQTAKRRELPAGAEAISLLGKTLVSRPPAGEAKTRLDAELAAAQRDFDASAANGVASADAFIWLGRRTAYLGRFRDAIAIYTRGIAAHPNDARLYRHRGHRYITVRELHPAIADLERAATLAAGKDEVEPDGRPNARNTPIGTTQSNIYYHLGLAYYLQGDFRRALTAYQECMKFSGNPDRLVSTSHWLYMTLRRLGRTAEAARVLEAITPQMDIIENRSYHRLLLLYKGVLTPQELLGKAVDANDPPTIGYGVANWHYYNGRREEALALWRIIVEGETWAAFGYIAAEAELARAH